MTPQERDVIQAITRQPKWLASSYPPAEIWAFIEYVATRLAEQPARPGEPRMIRDRRFQIDKGNR